VSRIDSKCRNAAPNGDLSDIDTYGFVPILATGPVAVSAATLRPIVKLLKPNDALFFVVD
jgi:hypothetical protein